MTGAVTTGSGNPIHQTELPDVLIVRPRRHGDARGWFSETFRMSWFESASAPTFVQDNHSFTAPALYGTGLALSGASPCPSEAGPRESRCSVRCRRGHSRRLSHIRSPCERDPERRWLGAALRAGRVCARFLHD